MFFMRDPAASLHLIVVKSAMRNAACCANVCTNQAFLPRIVLRIAAWLTTVKPRFGVDARTMPKFEEFTFLWVAHAIYQMVAIEREEDRLDMVAKALHEYRTGVISKLTTGMRCVSAVGTVRRGRSRAIAGTGTGAW